MKLRLSILALLTTLLTLSSCNKADNAILVMRLISNDSSLVKIDVDTLSSMVNSEKEFIFYYSSSTCGSCINIRPALEKYIKTRNIAIYQIEDVFNDSIIDIQNSKGEYIFSEYNGQKPLIYTPTLTIINNGERAYTLPNSWFQSENNLFNTIDTYYNFASSYLVQDIEKLTESINDNKYIIATYNTNTIGSLSRINKKLFDLSNSTGKPVYFVESNLLLSDSLVNVTINNEVVTLSDNHIYYYENKIMAADYSDHEIDNIIDNLFK